MAIGETAKLIASLELKDLFTKNLNAAEKSLGHFDTTLGRTEGRASRAGQQIGTGIKRGIGIAVAGVGFLAANVALGVASLERLENVTTQTNAVLKSTKGVAGQTAQGIRDMATGFENLNATMDDTVIQSGENVLLTFTNIRQKAFKPAIQAALDLSTAMGQDLQTSVVQIGKALNDPVKGLTSLQRVGVTFTAQQKEQIKSLEKQGKTFQAQKVILKELNTEFGGSFIGQGQTTAGKFAKVRDAVDDLQRSLAKALLPALTRVADVASTFLGRADVQRQVEQVGQAIAGLFSEKNLQQGARLLQTAFETFQTAAPILEASAKAALGFVKAGVDIFNTLPDPIKALVIGGVALNKVTGGLVTNIGGALIDLIGKSRGASPANPVFVSDVTGGIGGAAGAGGIGGLLRTVITKLGGLALVGGGLAGIGVGTSIGGPAGAGAAALGGAATIAGGALIAGPLGAIAGSLVAVGKTLIDIRNQSASQGNDIAASVGKEIGGGAQLADLHKSLDAVNQGINDIQANPLNVLVAGDALDQLRAQRDALEKSIAQREQIGAATVAAVKNANAILDRGGRETGKAIDLLAGKERDDILYMTHTLAAAIHESKQAIDTLRKSSDPKAIVHSVDVLKTFFSTQGHGNLRATLEAAASIKSALGRIHDPKLREVLQKALKDLQNKLPALHFIADANKHAAAIERSTKPLDQKLRELKGVENDLAKRHLPAAAKAIQGRIDALKASEAAKQAETTRAVKEKDLSLALTVNNPVTINSRLVNKSNSRYSNFYNFGHGVQGG